MIGVAKHIVEAYMINRRLVDIEQSKQQSKPSKVHYQPLPVSNQEQQQPPRKFAMQGSIDRFKGFHSKHRASKDIWKFLCKLEYIPTCDQAQATTWLELYIMYRCMGFQKPLLDNPSKARSKATVQMQLRKFKAVLRGVASRGIYHHEQLGDLKLVRVN